MSEIDNNDKINEAIRLSTSHNTDFGIDIDTHVGKIYENSLDLSFGQWQKLAIARAIMPGSSIIIMDEPTAALDPLSESQIYENFKTAMKNHTCLLISHRLAMTRVCDKIILIRDGKVAESGSFEELITMKGCFFEMYQAQSKLYKS